jgi:hypothetical protein
MILKVKIKPIDKGLKNTIEVWVERNKELDLEVAQLFQFFETQLSIKKVRRFNPYFKITSSNPAMILSLISSLQELISEIYFRNEENLEIDEKIHIE